MGYISHDKMLNEFIRTRRQEILSPYIIGAKLSHRKKSWRIAHNFTLSLSPPQKEKKNVLYILWNHRNFFQCRKACHFLTKILPWPAAAFEVVVTGIPDVGRAGGN